MYVSKFGRLCSEIEIRWKSEIGLFPQGSQGVYAQRNQHFYCFTPKVLLSYTTSYNPIVCGVLSEMTGIPVGDLFRVHLDEE